MKKKKKSKNTTNGQTKNENIKRTQKTEQIVKLNSDKYHNKMILQVEYFVYPHSVSNLYKDNITI